MPAVLQQKRKIVELGRLLDEEIKRVKLNTTHPTTRFSLSRVFMCRRFQEHEWHYRSHVGTPNQKKIESKPNSTALNKALRSPLHSFSTAGIVSELRLHFRGVAVDQMRLCPRGGRVNASSGIVSSRSGRSPLTLRHSTWECSLWFPVCTYMEEWSMYVCMLCVSMYLHAVGPLGKFRCLIHLCHRFLLTGNSFLLAACYV